MYFSLSLGYLRPAKVWPTLVKIFLDFNDRLLRLIRFSEALVGNQISEMILRVFSWQWDWLKNCFAFAGRLSRSWWLLCWCWFWFWAGRC
jgi:hypothetical protein